LVADQISQIQNRWRQQRRTKNIMIVQNLIILRVLTQNGEALSLYNTYIPKQSAGTYDLITASRVPGRTQMHKQVLSITHEEYRS